MAASKLEIYGCMNHPYEFLASFLKEIGMDEGVWSCNGHGDQTVTKEGREVTLSADGREYGELIAKVSRDADAYGSWAKKRGIALYARVVRQREAEVDLGDWLG